MPADLGTKPVGPTRLEDLLKICDLMTPHLQSDEEPPRPTVATVTSAPSGFMSTFLASIMLAQVVEARAVKLQVEGSMGEALAFGFMMGFGIGCGLWFAKWVERCIHRCWCPPREGNIGPQSRVRPNVSREASSHRESQSSQGLALEGGLGSGGAEGLHDYEELFERELQDVYVPEEIQGGSGNSSEVLIPLADGTLVDIQVASDADVRNAYFSDLRAAFGESEVPVNLRSEADRLRALTLFGPPRAPTVNPPPGYPAVYADDQHVAQLDLNEPDQLEDEDEDSDESESSPSTGGSTETGGEVRSGNSRSSRASGVGSVGSLAMVGLMSMPQGAQGMTSEGSDPQDGSWELGIIVSLVVLVSMGLGALAMSLWWRCIGRSDERRSADCTEDQGLSRPSLGATPTRIGRTEDGSRLSSPIVNIHVTGNFRDEASGIPLQSIDPSGLVSFRTCAQRTRVGDVVSQVDDSQPLQTTSRGSGLSDAGAQQERVAELVRRQISFSNSPVDPSGLDPRDARVQQVCAADHAKQQVKSPVDPSGLAPKHTRVQQACAADSAKQQVKSPVDPSGLAPKDTRVQQACAADRAKQQVKPPVDPSGLVPKDTHEQHASAAEEAKQCVETPVALRNLGSDGHRAWF